MLRRKVMDTLKAWRCRPHKCVLMKGQRQVGKTFIIRRFAESEYEGHLEIDFSKNMRVRKVFDIGLNVDEIADNLPLCYGKKSSPERGCCSSMRSPPTPAFL